MPILEVPIHLQDDSDSCGQACAQMVLRFLDQQIFQQSDLDSKRPAYWDPGTTPDQLQDIINRNGQEAGYSVLVTASQGEALGALEASLVAGAPSIALVNLGQHWVVIRGITRRGSTGGVVHIRNPMPPIDIVSELFAHADEDDCADLDFEGHDEDSDEAVSLREWQRTFFTTCQILKPARWKDRYVVVGR
jgi:uncharacterized protein (DUF2237 family)